MIKNLGIAGKLTLMNLLVSAIALLLACAAFLVYDQASFRANRVRAASTVAQMLSTSSESALVFNDPESAETTLSSVRGSEFFTAVALFNPAGESFAGYNTGAPLAWADAPAIPAGEWEAHDFRGSHIVLSRRIEQEGKPLGTIVVRVELRDLGQRLQRYLLIASGVLLLSLIAALFLSARARRGIALPITALAHTAERVSREKDYTVRAATPDGGPRDEVATLVHAFNNMLAEIHRRDSELRETHDRLLLAQATARLGDWQWDLDTHRVSFSEAAQALHGVPDSAGDWTTLLHAIYPDDRERVETALRDALNTGQLEVDYRVSRGHDVAWVLSQAVLQRAHNGQSAKLLGVSMDITKLKLAQEALLRSEKLAAAGRLAASISHEINNPLESVTNLLYLVANDPQLTDSSKHYMRQAEEELARVAQIASQTLRFYRQTTNPSPADLGELLDSVLKLMKNRILNASAEIFRDYRARTLVFGFEGELRQVFTNLIANALDALPAGGGRVILRTSPARLWDTGEAAVRVSVADTGVGMSADVSRKLFEPFYSTKGQRGTGLGLWVSKEIVAKHRGVMKVRSRAGRGTVFSVVIPVRAIATPQSAVGKVG